MVPLLSVDVSTPFLAGPLPALVEASWQPPPGASVPPANNALGSWNCSGFSEYQSPHNKLSSGCTLGFLVIYWTIHLFPWDFGLSFTRPPQTHYRSGGWTSLPLLEFAGNKKAPSKPAWAACLVSTRGCHVVHVAPKRPKTFCSLPA